jgi:3-oxoacyl-[acyl-carrier-protein] synthase III
MAFQTIKNVKIVGVAATVPNYVEENSTLNLFQSNHDYRKFVESTGVARRHIAPDDVCASDLCLKSAEVLLDELCWKKEEIDCLIFVSHSPDYRYPATACILQSRLGLSNSCMSFDISLGCSGWVYGLSVAGSLLSSGNFKKALLLVGDVTSRSKSPEDKSTFPLFGDSGSATAIVYDDGANGFLTHLGTDGNKYDTILIEDGGSRNPATPQSFEKKEYAPGIVRNRLQTGMDGMSVFSFGISRAPKSVRALLQNFKLKQEEIDYFLFHQANLMMNKKIQQKLNLPDEKVPYALKNFGNTSSGSIPLTMVSEIQEVINRSADSPLKMIACGFGVGLSWGSVYFELNETICCNLLTY